MSLRLCGSLNEVIIIQKYLNQFAGALCLNGGGVIVTEGLGRCFALLAKTCLINILRRKEKNKKKVGPVVNPWL